MCYLCKCYVLFKCVIYVCVHVSVMCYLSVVIYVCVHVSVMCYLSVNICLCSCKCYVLFK